MQARINTRDLDVSQRRDKNTEAKRKIAEKAMGLIKDGDMVFLDVSTANLELARLLVHSGMHVTVATNMVDILLEFTAPTSVKFIFIGGCLSSGRDYFVGAYTNKLIAEFRYDLAFLSNVGVDLFENSVFTYMADDGLAKDTILNASRKSYLLLETRKLSMDGTYKYASIDRFSGVVMEKELPAELLDQAKEYQVEWI